MKELTQAWELYYHVFRRISKQLPQVRIGSILEGCPSCPVPLPLQLTTLELQYVSPKLMGCEDLELAVPGTYEPNQPVIHIRRVSPTLNVITSKQRPRKLIIQGQLMGPSWSLIVTHTHTHTRTHAHAHTHTHTHTHTYTYTMQVAMDVISCFY